MATPTSIQKGYRVPVRDGWQSEFVSFIGLAWRCTCAQYQFLSKRTYAHECPHIVAVKTFLRSQEVQMQDTAGPDGVLRTPRPVGSDPTCLSYGDEKRCT
jgi:hypothetical protein